MATIDARESAAARPKARARLDWVGLTKPVVVLAGLVPALRLVHGVFWNPEALGANPAETIEHVTGDWCLHFLLITLSVSPLRRLTGWNALIRFRRMLGLFAFFYGLLHVFAYLGFDMVFDPGSIAKDILKRPFVTVGFAALVLMTPLAVTSTKGWIRRLGGANWNRLHQLVYPIAVLGVVHYWWLVKRDVTWPAVYAGILVLLLGWRVWLRFRKRPPRQRGAA